jgi:hypothetical protein
LRRGGDGVELCGSELNLRIEDGVTGYIDCSGEYHEGEMCEDGWELYVIEILA